MCMKTIEIYRARRFGTVHEEDLDKGFPVAVNLKYSIPRRSEYKIWFTTKYEFPIKQSKPNVQCHRATCILPIRRYEEIAWITMFLQHKPVCYIVSIPSATVKQEHTQMIKVARIY